MKFLLAKKVNMTQVFTESGLALPVTVLSVGSQKITQVKDTEKDGYKAVQIGLEGKKKTTKREYRLKDGEEPKAKDEAIDVSAFSEGDTVSVVAISKGKGFQGVVKRHKFKGGRRSHGQKHSEREAGSIGGGGRAGGRVVKGMRMAGRMGGEKVTVKNLQVVKVLPETSEIMIRGAVPGRRGTLVEIRG
jgi:large subunit ribosomal protein L3